MFRIGTPRGNSVFRRRQRDPLEALQVKAGRRTQALYDRQICPIDSRQVSGRFKTYCEDATPEMLRALPAREKQAHWKEYEN
jgi:hypothetical protein